MNQRTRIVPLDKRVNTLFATVIDGDGIEVAASAVAQALSQKLGRPVATKDIEALRLPGAQQPADDILAELARYFDMPDAFLSSDPDQYYAPYHQLGLLIMQRDKRIPFLALRADSDQLGEDAVQELTKYLDSLD
ncbi:hypothetical protein [Nocardia sp. NPDC058705]|uniref:hypothetical protein n=1 Tax=Nocardia sp. NPDC058705 TaxID=3346609 RepID=UPI0036ABD997